MAFVGVDWAKKGWLAVRLNGDTKGKENVQFYSSFYSLWTKHSDCTSILVDIPIGLACQEPRPSDKEAKNFLDEVDGNFSGSVFKTPTLEAVYARNLEQAKDQQTFGITNQAWGIVPCIRELDRFLRENKKAREKVYETHPEICFQMLSRCADSSIEVTARKSEQEGQEQREEVLKDYLDENFDELKASFEELTKPKYAPIVSSKTWDDFLDATACALTAKLIEKYERNTIPDNPENDKEGLDMGIHYFAPESGCRLMDSS